MAREITKTDRTLFSTKEKDIFFKFVKENINIIEHKSNDAKSIKARQDKWAELSQKLSILGYNRSALQLRQLWFRTKGAAKKNIVNYNKKIKEEEGEPVTSEEPSETDWLVSSLCPYDFIDERSICDSDSRVEQYILDTETSARNERETDFPDKKQKIEDANWELLKLKQQNEKLDIEIKKSILEKLELEKEILRKQIYHFVE